MLNDVVLYIIIINVINIVINMGKITNFVICMTTINIDIKKSKSNLKIILIVIKIILASFIEIFSFKFFDVYSCKFLLSSFVIMLSF